MSLTNVEKQGFTRLTPKGASKTGSIWERDRSGWIVRHCGHMTANWPYYIEDPDRPRICIVTHNGLGFQTLRHAFQAIRGIEAGTLLVTTYNCFDGVARVLDRNVHKSVIEADTTNR